MALSPPYIMNEHWWDVAWPNFSRWFRFCRRQSPIQVSFDDILGWCPHTWKSAHVGHHHKMLMFMGLRQYNSSRSLITPSTCYDNWSVYSDLLITRIIYATMEFYANYSASHFMRLRRKGTHSSDNVVSSHIKRRTVDGYRCYMPEGSQFYTADTPITHHNTRVVIFWWASQITQNQ